MIGASSFKCCTRRWTLRWRRVSETYVARQSFFGGFAHRHVGNSSNRRTTLQYVAICLTERECCVDRTATAIDRLLFEIHFRCGRSCLIVAGMLYGEADALNSSYHISYNMLLNMLRVEDADPDFLVKSSFHQFQQEASAPALEASLNPGSPFRLILNLLQNRLCRCCDAVELLRLLCSMMRGPKKPAHFHTVANRKKPGN